MTVLGGHGQVRRQIRLDGKYVVGHSRAEASHPTQRGLAAVNVLGLQAGNYRIIDWCTVLVTRCLESWKTKQNRNTV